MTFKCDEELMEDDDLRNKFNWDCDGLEYLSEESFKEINYLEHERKSWRRI